MTIELPKNPDVETMKMLIRARNFLEHATMHASINTEFDRMIAIHNLDNSIEYILRIIIKHLQITEITGKTIDTPDIAQIIGEIEKFLKDHTTVHLSYITEIKLIRNLRNLVQHAMIDPAADLNTLLPIGHKFFERSLEKFFGMTASDIRYSTLIENDILKNLLKTSETFIEQKNYLESVVYSRNAFEYACLIFNKGSHQRIRRAPTLVEIRDKFPSLCDYLETIDKKIQLDSYKVDINLYDRFTEYIDHIPAEFCADWHSNTVMQREWEAEDAVFCYQFVSDIIYKWQTMKAKPLYTVEDISPRSIIRKINNININEELQEYSCIYAYGQESGELFFAGKDTKDKIKARIHEKQIYLEEHEAYESEILLNKSSILIFVDFVRIELASNDPALWEIIIWFRSIPFTYVNQNSEEIIDINSCGEDLLNAGLPQEITNEVAAYRSEFGDIDTVDKAFKLQDLFKEHNFSIKTNLISQVLINKYVE